MAMDQIDSMKHVQIPSIEQLVIPIIFFACIPLLRFQRRIFFFFKRKFQLVLIPFSSSSFRQVNFVGSRFAKVFILCAKLFSKPWSYFSFRKAFGTLNYDKNRLCQILRHFRRWYTIHICHPLTLYVYSIYSTFISVEIDVEQHILR